MHSTFHCMQPVQPMLPSPDEMLDMVREAFVRHIELRWLRLDARASDPGIGEQDAWRAIDELVHL